MVHWAPTFMCREAVSTCPYSAKGLVFTSGDIPITFIPLFSTIQFSWSLSNSKIQYAKIMTGIVWDKKLFTTKMTSTNKTGYRPIQFSQITYTNYAIYAKKKTSPGYTENQTHIFLSDNTCIISALISYIEGTFDIQTKKGFWLN